MRMLSVSDLFSSSSLFFLLAPLLSYAVVFKKDGITRPLEQMTRLIHLHQTASLGKHLFCGG